VITFFSSFSCRSVALSGNSHLDIDELLLKLVLSSNQSINVLLASKTSAMFATIPLVTHCIVFDM
jgi:cell division septal protein FtsQ